MARQRRKVVERTPDERQEIYEDTLDALAGACSRFDKGDTREYRMMAALIRNLCRDTRMSKSLLGQLGLKSRHFLTSSSPLEPGNTLAECHLVELLMRPKLPSKTATWQSVLDDAPMAFVPFDDWWTASVIRQPDGNQFSRDAVVGYVADQDGGVHLDPEIDAAFQEMRQDAFRYTSGRSTTEHVDRHVIRQVAHELLKSLRPSYRRSHKLSGAFAVFRAPFLAAAGVPRTKMLLGYHNLLPTETCPCGSDLQFGACHRRGASPPREVRETNGNFLAPPGAAFARFRFEASAS